MKKKYLIFTILGGAAIAALSFLLAEIKDDTAQNVRWAIFTFGLIAVVVGVALLCLAFILSRKGRLLPDGAEYQKKKSLMSPKESEFFVVLCSLIDLKRYIVLPQISLVSVIDKVKGGAFRNELFRIADYCIVDRRNYEPLVLVELNDASHKRDDRKLRDAKVNAICKDAGISILTVGLNEIHDERALRYLFKKYI